MRSVFNSFFRPRLGRTLHNIIWFVRHEDRTPFGLFRARADVNRFLSAPSAFSAATTEPCRPGLGGRHVQFAMEAQALAFQGKPEAAAERMQDALDALPRPDALKDAQARNTAEIHSLGATFITEQRLRAGDPAPPTLARAPGNGASPPMSFVEYMRALHLIHAKDFDGACGVIAEFDKIFPRLTLTEQADFAVSLAALCLDLDTLAPRQAQSALKRGLFKKTLQAFEIGDRKALSSDWQTSLLYWNAVVLRCQSALEEATDTGKAADLLEKADALLQKAEKVNSSERWGTVIEYARDQVLKELARIEIENGRIGPARKRLKGERAGTQGTRSGPPLGWQWLFETWSNGKTAEAEEFVGQGLHVLAGHLLNRPDGSEGRRLVLEVSENIIAPGDQGDEKMSLGDEKMSLGAEEDAPQPETDDILKPKDLLREMDEPEDARILVPSIPALRRYMRRTYDLSLPGILVSYYPSASDDGTAALIVDGTPISEHLPIPAGQKRFVIDPDLQLSRQGRAIQSETPAADRDVFEIELEPVPESEDTLGLDAPKGP